jgi:dUTP pyrophosphatase
MVPTGIAIAIPEGYVGLVWDKSSVPLKWGVTKMSGVLDAGYRGEILLVMHNTSDEDVAFEAGQKVAQLLIQPVVRGDIVEAAELDETSRGANGFGSTGK